MGRMHSPEGTRDLSQRKLRTGSLGVIVLLCASFAIGISGESANLTVRNQTRNVLTIVIAGRTYKSVAAGAAVSYAAGDSATVAVTASYAAGQGVTGTAQRSFFLASAQSQGSYTYIACGVNAPIVSPAPVEWDVTADTLAASTD